MKRRTSRGVALNVLAAASLFVISPDSSAIENLKIAVQCPNAVLTWPSRTGETYIVQYRSTLDAQTPWVTLTNGLPAALSTNATTFVHSNVMECVAGMPGSGGSGGGGAPPSPFGSLSANASTTMTEEQLVARAAELQQRASESIKELTAKLIAATEKAKADQAKWLREGRPTLRSETSNSGATLVAEADSLPAVTNAGFYRVVRNGVHFSGVTNGQVFSEIVSLPVEVGLANPSDPPTDITLAPIADGESIVSRPSGIESYYLDGANPNPVLIWDTHLVTNGTYVLQPSATLQSGENVVGDPVNVIVSNRIQMPKNPEWIVSGLPIYAIIDQPSASYTITVRDHQGTVVRTMTGQAANYIINHFWNGQDGFGNNVLVNHRYFDVTLSYNPSYSYRVWVFTEDDFLDGQWLISFQDGLYGGANQIVFLNSMQQVSEFAADEGLVMAPYHQIDASQADWAAWTNYLIQPDCRNVYYWGHGSPTGVGFSRNNQTIGLRAPAVQGALGNIVVTNLNEIQIHHAFRFVWLDGCQTGSKGSSWPRTFGIQPVQLDEGDFANM